MNAVQLGFTFVGGFKDGCTLRGNPLACSERLKVHNFATITQDGEIGKKFKGRSHATSEAVAGESSPAVPNHKYEVVKRTTEEDGLVMVSCQFIGTE